MRQVIRAYVRMYVGTLRIMHTSGGYTHVHTFSKQETVNMTDLRKLSTSRVFKIKTDYYTSPYTFLVAIRNADQYSCHMQVINKLFGNTKLFI